MIAPAYYNEFDPYAAAWLRNLIAAGLIPAGDVDERSIIDVAADDLAGYRQCHFFAGIGGWALAARIAGWPDDRELWTGSCPCQPFSVAGKGAGAADDRHLWPDFFRLIRARRPAVVMGEQVAAAIGKAWLDGIFADLEGIAYACRAVVLPACAVDAPHGRDRLWFVADSGGEGLAQREREPGVLCRLGGETEGQDAADDAGAMGHADVVGAGEERQQRGRQFGGAGGDQEARARVVADSSRLGCDERQQPGSDPDGFGSGAEHARHSRPSAWTDACWIVGHDGKARRVKPGVRLLAHGISGRMVVVRTDEQTGAEVSHWYNRIGALRGFGNAIVPEEAAEVIGAFMDCRPVLERAA